MAAQQCRHAQYTGLYTWKTFKGEFVFFNWLCWVFVAAWVFLQLLQVGATLQMRGASLSLQSLLLLWSGALGLMSFSSCSSQALEHRLGDCGTRIQFFHSVWDLPRPGIEPMFLALAGRFFTTEPPGNFYVTYILSQ